MKLLQSQKKQLGTGGSRLGLSTNDKITVEHLLYGLMMVSGNDAAIALSEFISGSTEDFAKLMNQKAENIGLKSTHFETPHGLDSENHYTTAYELALLTNYALKNDVFCKIVNTKNYIININKKPKSLQNTNELLGNFSGIYGVKTGFTNGANRCLVTCCKKNNMDVICVVLGCDTKRDRTKDTIALINYALNNFTLVDVEQILDNEFNNWLDKNTDFFIINKGCSKTLNLYLNKSQLPYNTIAIKKTDLNNITANVDVLKVIQAPIKEKEVIGKIQLQVNNTPYFSIDILNSNPIKRKNIPFYLYTFFKHYFEYFNITS